MTLFPRFLLNSWSLSIRLMSLRRSEKRGPREGDLYDLNDIYDG